MILYDFYHRKLCNDNFFFTFIDSLMFYPWFMGDIFPRYECYRFWCWLTFVTPQLGFVMGFESYSMIVNILERMSLSLGAVSPCTKIKHLKMSFEISFILNSSRWELSVPGLDTKSSFSCLMIFKHLYRVWKRLSRLSRIIDNVLMVSSKKISFGFLDSIRSVYFVFSW